jgi:hypothetical protein
MCVKFPERPYALPLETHYTRNNILVLTFSLVLLKVTELRHGLHVSSRGFPFPMRQSVYDPNVRIGHHDYGLHFAASPEGANKLKGSYGSHRLAVLPAPEVWDSVEKAGQTKRCWHSSGAHTLMCLDCNRVELDVLDTSDFWEDLTIRPGRSKNRFGIPLDAVWHRTKEQGIGK